MVIPAQTRQAAAKELLARRKARSSLLECIKYTAPWFKVSWHHELVCELLERVERPVESGTITLTTGSLKGWYVPAPKHIRRLMVFAPPRHSKSEVVSIRRPAYSIGRDSTRMFMSIAYGSDLAVTFSKACTGTMQSQAFQRIFPVKFDRLAKERWKVVRKEEEDNQRDSMIASGIMSPLTGEGATDVNIDDPFKNKSEAYSKVIRDKVWDEYQTSIRTRLQKGASVCLMMTRWHNDDLAARLIKQAQSNKRADQWIVLVLAATNDDGLQSYVWDTRTGVKTHLPPYAALWPDFLSREDLDTTRASMSDPFWQAMYQQAPTTATGSIFKADKWQEVVLPINYERLVHCWDTAMEDTDTADFSAFQSMGVADGRFIIPDAYRARLTFPELTAEVYKRWQRDLDAGLPLERLLIEQKGSGISLIQTIEANNIDPYFTGPRIPVLGMPATLSKVVRALSVSGYQEAGLIALPAPTIDAIGNVIPPMTTDKDGNLVEWVGDFIEEHSAFPKAPNDDQVDCTVHSLTYFTRPIDDEYSETMVHELEDVSISSELDSIDRGW